MGITSTYKKAGYGRRLAAADEVGSHALARLGELRVSLPDLRSEIQADTDLSASEVAEAVAEVDELISGLVTQIKAFAGSL